MFPTTREVLNRNPISPFSSAFFLMISQKYPQ
jgi:hypothetical protein